MRSPSFRAMAWLAWLILAFSPAHAGSAAAMAGALPGDHMAIVTHAAEHHSATMADDCCASHDPAGQVSHDACTCAAMCASPLPAMAVAALSRVAPDASPASPRRLSAPGGVHAPVLRPPKA